MAYIFGGNSAFGNAAEANLARERALGNIDRAQSAEYNHAAPALVGLLSSIVNRQRLGRANKAQSSFADAALRQMGAGSKYMPGLDVSNLTLAQKGDLLTNAQQWYGTDRAHGQAMARQTHAADLAASADVRKMQALTEAFGEMGVEFTPDEKKDYVGIDTGPGELTPAQLAEAQFLADRGMARDPNTGDVYKVADRLRTEGGPVSEAIAAEEAKTAAATETKNRQTLAEMVAIQDAVERLRESTGVTTQGRFAFLPNVLGGQTEHNNALEDLRKKIAPIAIARHLKAGLPPPTTDLKYNAIVDAAMGFQRGDKSTDLETVIRQLEQKGYFDPTARQKWEALIADDVGAVQSQFGGGNNLDASLIALEG